MAERPFTTVEMTVLGLTWLRGPCSVYVVMKELSLSESTFHRSRAGTAYSIVNRLLKLGHLRKSEDGLVSVTATGESVLREWTGPEVPMLDVAHTADLLRLRCFFLGVLPESDRVAFVDKSLASLREFEQRCVELVHANEAIGDYYGVLATSCLVLETRARAAWLENVRPLIASPLPKEGGWASRVLQAIGSVPAEEATRPAP